MQVNLHLCCWQMLMSECWDCFQKQSQEDIAWDKDATAATISCWKVNIFFWNLCFDSSVCPYLSLTPGSNSNMGSCNWAVSEKKKSIFYLNDDNYSSKNLTETGLVLHHSNYQLFAFLKRSSSLTRFSPLFFKLPPTNSSSRDHPRAGFVLPPRSGSDKSLLLGSVQSCHCWSHPAAWALWKIWHLRAKQRRCQEPIRGCNYCLWFPYLRVCSGQWLSPGYVFPDLFLPSQAQNAALPQQNAEGKTHWCWIIIDVNEAFPRHLFLSPRGLFFLSLLAYCINNS